MIPLLCLTAYTIASLVVGVRLLALARRTRGAPELLAGLTYFCAPGLGYPLQVVAGQIADRAISVPMTVAGQSFIVFGCSCFLFFTVQVFRKEASWAAWIGTLGLTYAGTASAYAVISYSDPAEILTHARLPSAALLTVLALAWGWTALEGLRYYRMMRKRMTLGLADAVVTNRFLLWGLNGLTSVGWLSISISMFVAGENLTTSSLVVTTTSAGGVANAVFLFLIFMPPAVYTRWVERSARGAALAAA